MKLNTFLKSTLAAALCIGLGSFTYNAVAQSITGGGGGGANSGVAPGVAYYAANGTTVSDGTVAAVKAGSLALGGATIGSNALAVTGTANISGGTTVGSLSSGGNVAIASGSDLFWTNRALLRSPSDGVLQISNFALSNSFTITAGAANLATFNGGVTLSGSLVSGNNVQAVAAGSFNWNGRASIYSPSDGTIYFRDNANAAYANLSAAGGTFSASIGVSGGISASRSPAVSQSAQIFDGTLQASGTGTTNLPHLLFQPSGTTAATTWSTAGTGLGMNLASGFNGNFLDFHVAGGASVFRVGAAGNIASTSYLSLAGGGSSAAWTTGGLKFAISSATFTDTSSSGTVAAQYVNAFKAPTIAASSATTFTNSYNLYVENPIAGTNVTQSSAWALGADSLKVNGAVNGGTASFSGSASATSMVATTAASGFQFASGGNNGALSSTADGVFRVTNGAGTGFTGLLLGPSGTAYPSLRPTGTAGVLALKLADNSGDAALTASNLTLSGLSASSAVCTDGSKVLTTSGCTSAFPTVVAAKNNADQSLSSTTTTVKISFQTEDVDNSSAFASSTFTAPATGCYRATYTLFFTGSPTRVITEFQANGASVFQVEQRTLALSVFNAHDDRIICISSGQTIEVWGAMQGTTPSVQGTGSGVSSFSVQRVS